MAEQIISVFVDDLTREWLLADLVDAVHAVAHTDEAAFREDRPNTAPIEYKITISVEKKSD